MKSLHDQIDAIYARAEADEIAGRRHSVALYGRIAIGLIKQLIADDALKSASALAYTTILSMIPLLAVSFAVLNGMVASEEVALAVRKWLLNSFLADSVGEVTTFIDGFLSRANDGTVGLVGFIFLMVTSVSLFLSIESAFNQIWRVAASRPLVRRLTTFYAVLTLTPALLALAFAGTRWAQGGLADWPLFHTVVGTVLPWFLEAMALTLMYKLLPHTPVRWQAATMGGVAAAVGFEITKWGFNAYVQSIYSGSVPSKIYGSFALVPIFFLWVYLVWIIILCGVEFAYMVQNHRLITGRMLSRRSKVREGLPAPPNGYLCTRVIFEVALHFRQRGGGVSPLDIASKLQIPTDEVHAAVLPLVRSGLLLLVEDEEDERLVPGRALNSIRLADVYATTADKGYQPGELPGTPSARALEAAVTAAMVECEAALAVDLATLIDGDRRAKP